MDFNCSLRLDWLLDVLLDECGCRVCSPQIGRVWHYECILNTLMDGESGVEMRLSPKTILLRNKRDTLAHFPDD